MSEKSRSVREERLRAVLREGDPAGAEGGPAPEEVRRMRRAVLTALAPDREPRRRAFWLPVAAVAAAAALTLAIAFGLWRAHTDAAAPATETGRQAAVTAPTLAPAPVAPAPVAPAPRVDPPRTAAPPFEASRQPRARRAPTLEPMRLASAVEETPAAEPESSLPLEDSEIRQVQFDAPAGTRVIWMLSSETVVEDR